MSNEKAAPLVAQQEPQKGKNESQTSFPMPILPNLPADVKLLQEFQQRSIPNADIVDSVRAAFPGFDKTLLSKCRNPRHYGIGLLREAVKLLAEHFHAEAQKPRSQPRRRKPKRIQCRLTETVYAALQRRTAQTGQTTQEYLEALITHDLIQGGEIQYDESRKAVERDGGAGHESL